MSRLCGNRPSAAAVCCLPAHSHTSSATAVFDCFKLQFEASSRMIVSFYIRTMNIVSAGSAHVIIPKFTLKFNYLVNSIVTPVCFFSFLFVLLCLFYKKAITLGLDIQSWVPTLDISVSRNRASRNRASRNRFNQFCGISAEQEYQGRTCPGLSVRVRQGEDQPNRFSLGKEMRAGEKEREKKKKWVEGVGVSVWGVLLHLRLFCFSSLHCEFCSLSLLRDHLGVVNEEAEVGTEGAPHFPR